VEAIFPKSFVENIEHMEVYRRGSPTCSSKKFSPKKGDSLHAPSFSLILQSLMWWRLSGDSLHALSPLSDLIHPITEIRVDKGR
jgi:hypothetical protein